MVDFFTPTIEVSAFSGSIFIRKSKGGGRDSGFVGIPDEELQEALGRAKAEGKKALALRIIRELKNSGERNKRKRRGGPHMRGWFILFLLLGSDRDD